MNPRIRDTRLLAENCPINPEEAAISCRLLKPSPDGGGADAWTGFYVRGFHQDCTLTAPALLLPEQPGRFPAARFQPSLSPAQQPVPASLQTQVRTELLAQKEPELGCCRIPHKLPLTQTAIILLSAFSFSILTLNSNVIST